MLIANGCHDANLPDAPEHVRGNVGTARMVAQIFHKQFFAAVWSLQARLYGCRRNRKPSNRVLVLSAR